MYALSAHSLLTHSVDSSKKAQDWALRNAELNKFNSDHTFFQEDVFDFLKKSTQKYDAPGGILFTFSCSQVIDKELFRKIVFQAAAQTGRNVRILHQLSQGPDHPISIYHPEGEYLKGLVLLVD